MPLPVDPLLFGSFLLATAVMIASPGPIVGLMIARTLEDGRAHGLAVALGAASGACLFMAAALSGLATLTSLDPIVFDLIRWAGAVYFLYLALQAWRRARPEQMTELSHKRHVSLAADYRLAVVITLSSPKMLVFFGAFFPLFLDAALPRVPQLWTMAIGFLIVSFSLDCCWVMVSGYARQTLLKRNARHLIDRVSASFLGLAALFLLLVD